MKEVNKLISKISLNTMPPIHWLEMTAMHKQNKKKNRNLTVIHSHLTQKIRVYEKE